MKIKTLEQGAYQTNSYVINNEDSNECIVIDTGLENSSLISYLEKSNLNPCALILTHGHLDHILGIDELRSRYPDIKVYIHKLDAQMLKDPDANMSSYTGFEFSTDPADILLNDADTIEIAGIKIEIIHIPGHTQGGICVYVPQAEAVFTGDCVFAGSIGRTDFPGCNEELCRKELVESIREKLLGLNENIKLYPGHGPSTTIRCEKKNNPYLNGSFPF